MFVTFTSRNVITSQQIFGYVTQVSLITSVRLSGGENTGYCLKQLKIFFSFHLIYLKVNDQNTWL